jgi:hypothetical protein
MSCNNTENSVLAGCAFESGQGIGVIVCPDNAGLTFAAANTLAAWNANMILESSLRWKVLMPRAPIAATPTQEAPVMYAENTNVSTFVNDGKFKYEFKYDSLTLGEIAALRTFNNTSKFVYILTSKEIFGRKTDTKVIPVPAKIYVSPIQLPKDNKSPSFIIVTIDFTETLDNLTYAVEPTILSVPFYPSTDFTFVTSVLPTFISADISDKTFIFTLAKYNNQREAISNLSLTTPTDIECYVISTGVALTTATITRSGSTYTGVVDVGTPLTAVPHGVRLKPTDTSTSNKTYETPYASNAITPAA